jgi:hypothetical protein
VWVAADGKDITEDKEAGDVGSLEHEDGVGAPVVDIIVEGPAEEDDVDEGSDIEAEFFDRSLAHNTNIDGEIVTPMDVSLTNSSSTASGMVDGDNPCAVSNAINDGGTEGDVVIDVDIVVEVGVEVDGCWRLVEDEEDEEDEDAAVNSRPGRREARDSAIPPEILRDASVCRDVSHMEKSSTSTPNSLPTSLSESLPLPQRPNAPPKPDMEPL